MRKYISSVRCLARAAGQLLAYIQDRNHCVKLEVSYALVQACSTVIRLVSSICLLMSSSACYTAIMSSNTAQTTSVPNVSSSAENSCNSHKFQCNTFGSCPCYVPVVHGYIVDTYLFRLLSTLIHGRCKPFSLFYSRNIKKMFSKEIHSKYPNRLYRVLSSPSTKSPPTHGFNLNFFFPPITTLSALSR